MRPDVSVITSGHDVADARLHRQVTSFRSAGLSVEVLGLGRVEQGPGGAVVRTWPRPSMAGRATLALRMALAARGGIFLTLDPDSAVAASPVARWRGRAHIVDVHEDYRALLHDRAWAKRWGGVPGQIAHLVVRGFLKVARTADLTVVADEHVPPYHARTRLVERNVPHPAMMPAPHPPGPRPRAVYVGDVRATRGALAMVRALALAPAWHLDVVGTVAAADAAAIEQFMQSVGPSLRSRITWHGRLPPAQAWAVAPGAWCGLSLLADTPAFRDAIPSKLYEYAACGLPAVTTNLERAAEYVRGHGGGVVVPCGSDDHVAEHVAQHLNAWVAHPQQHLALVQSATQAGRALAASPPFSQVAQWCVERSGQQEASA